MMPSARQRLKESSGLKSLLSIAIVVLIYFWSSASLGITLEKLTSGENWASMGDLIMRMGPFDKVQRCSDAELVWGTADPEGPWSEKLDPAKVAAVCERGEVVYWYRSDYLEEMGAYAKQMWGPLSETFRMALIGTGIGSLLAIPFSLLAARNLVRSKFVYYAVRVVLNLIRTVPDLVIASVMVGSFGLGPLPGVFALSIFSFALVAKLLSESVESIDPGPLEALKAVGGNSLQQIRYAVAPQVLPQYLAYTLYVLEIGVRASTVLGFVGAGGIGMTLQENLTLGGFRNIGVIITVMLVAVVVIDFVSTKLRERLI